MAQHPFSDPHGDLTPGEELRTAVEKYLRFQVRRTITGAGHKLEEVAARLEDPRPVSASRTGPGAAQRDGDGAVKDADEAESDDRSSPDSDRGSSGGGQGSSGGATTGSKLTNIVEDVKIGVGLRQVYNQWTLYPEFAEMMRGVVGVDAEDEVTTNWKVKVAKSNRSWTATVVEQVPDERIVWVSNGSKGSTRGVVTFHELDHNLTQVLVVIEYFPAGFFEKTANLWWAASRRARLDLKHFRRHIMMNGAASDEGWRGEVRDGEVVRSHDEVVQAEQEESDRRESDGDESGYERLDADDGDYEDRDEDEDESDDERDEDDEERDEDDEDEDREETERDDRSIPGQRRKPTAPRRPRRRQPSRG
ncbi:hypothetical protein GIY23_12030 [Allosaccharopolyspora coralli]|uniref:Coenzyme Q-binding protein COQ10 START domain-containing protein n=1 Tax=Allosaccharopolyspora coralli TaxID=2665642 RepID=A0A5Q3QFC3_9PSEU|nr:SRPBCC family protein [Allosaccharopolyspora coralli]QGK70159.1 hypothetical protein GIY23_12030 [Allosaccharopolyspora coralli]